MTVTALRANARVTGSWQKSSPSLGGTAGSVLDGIDNDTSYAEWIDIGPVTNNVLEFFSINLASLNSGNPIIVTSMRMDFSWRRGAAGGDVTGCAIINTAALDSNGNLVRGPDDGRIWGTAATNYPLGSIARPTRYATADGRDWSEFDTLGFTIEGIWGTGAGEYRIYDVQVYVDWLPGDPGGGGTTSITATITDPTASEVISGPVAVAWTYASTAGRPQTHYEVEITASGGTPGVGSEVWESGKIASESTRTVTVGVPLDPGSYDAHLRLWSTTAAGQAINSGWVEVAFSVPSETVAVPTPSAPESVALTWAEPAMTVQALEPEPMPVGYIAPPQMEIARSADGSAFETITTLTEWAATALETLLLEHDPEPVLILAQDLVTAGTITPAYPDGAAASGNGGSAPKALKWEGAHYVWLPGAAGNYMSMATRTFATASTVELLFDAEAADWSPATTQRISHGTVAQISCTSSTIEVGLTVSGTTSLWTATQAQLGLVDGERAQVRCVIDLVAGDCEFYTRDVAPDLLDGEGWTLATTDASASPALAASSRTTSTAVWYVGSTNAANWFEGKIYRVVARSNDASDADFYPNDIGSTDESNPDAGQTGWTGGAGVWTTNRSHNTSTTRSTAVVTQSVVQFAPTLADTMTFAGLAAKIAAITESGGNATIIWSGRIYNASVAQSLVSWTTTGPIGVELHVHTDGKPTITVVGASTSVSRATAGAQATHERFTVAAVIAAGTVAIWTPGAGMTATSSMAGIGAIAAPGTLTIGGRAHDANDRDLNGEFSALAVVDKALSAAELAAIDGMFTAGRRLDRSFTLVDWEAPQHSLVLYRARGLSADSSKASAWVSSALEATTGSGWLLATVELPGVEPDYIEPTVVEVERTEPEQVHVFDPLPPADRAIVVTSGPQAERLIVTFRTMDRTERRALEAFLGTRGPWRLVNSLGQEWQVRTAGERRPNWIPAKPTATETTGRRDMHEIVVPFVEVEA